MDKKVKLRVAPFVMNVQTGSNQSRMISGWFFGFPQKEYTADEARDQFRVFTSTDPVSDWSADECRWLGPIPDTFIRKLLEIYLQGHQVEGGETLQERLWNANSDDIPDLNEGMLK